MMVCYVAMYSHRVTTVSDALGVGNSGGLTLLEM